MTETKNLAAALAAFQAEMPTVHKGNRADVPTKSGGKYSYTYADLGDVTKAAMPLLSKHGLAFVANPRASERGGYELVGVLMHVSGEREEGALPIGGNGPQEMGSSLTYMRRYLLGCMTGIVTDDDDDGHAAQNAPKRAAKKAAQPPPPPEDLPPIRPEYDSGGHVIDVAGGPMKQATRGRLFALFGDLNIPDADQLPGINHILGTTYTSRSELTEEQARAVIKQLEQKQRSAREAS